MQYTERYNEWIPGYRTQINWNAIGANTLFAGLRHSASSSFYISPHPIAYVHPIADTYEMGWKYRKSKQELAVNIYYQEMRQLLAYPLDSDGAAFEYLADYPNSRYAGVLGRRGSGTSRHFGIEGRWNYKTSNGWKLNFNQSFYKSVRGIEDSTLVTGRYNGQYATHFTISKEIITSADGKTNSGIFPEGHPKWWIVGT